MKKLTVALVQVLGAGVALSVAMPAAAQQAQRIEKIEVTGSNIKQIEGETALPVTVIRVEDLARMGVTTAEQAIGRIASSQSSLGISQGIGATTGGQSEANLRGLGGNKTLVLLNGRRIANHAFDSGSVDLNAIPLAAIDRIEVLRDGASAIYGTDAIGGVINFILKRDFQGASVSVEAIMPRKDGGEEKRASATLGFGSLQKQGFNVFAVVDVHKQDLVRAIDRDFGSTGVRPERGLYNISGTGFPGNYSQGDIFVNPSAPGCRPSNGTQNLFDDGACYFDFTQAIDLVPESQQKSLVVKGTVALRGDATASLEYVRAENESINRVAPTPATGLPVPPNSPYYPGRAGGSVPGVPGIDNTANVTAAWRMFPAGKRTNEPKTVGERMIAEFDGAVAGWDFKAAGFWTRNSAEDVFTNGYIKRPMVLAGIRGQVPGSPGLFLNPFGDPTAPEQAYIDTLKVLGKVIEAKGEVTGFDLRGSREIGQMAGGGIGLAVGAEYRREEYTFDLIEENARVAQSSGLELTTDVGGKRNASAIFGEMNLPFTKTLEAQLALRYDRYSDAGNTINPKIGLRWQPSKNVLVRTSYNTGFRAPTLFELYQSEQFTFSSDAFNDPVLCPGGVPAPGAVRGRDCNQQSQVRQAGSLDLEPEKSRTAAIGVVFEPTNDMTVSLDYWNIRLKNSIAGLGEQTIVNEAARYADRFVRCSQVTAAQRASFDRCQIPGGDPLAYIDTALQNLGEVRTAGVDLSVAYRFPAMAFGRLSFSFDGTYVGKYDYQREKGGAFVNNVGSYQDASPVFRWQHTASLQWTKGPWSAVVGQRFKSGYLDQNFVDPEFVQSVQSYSVWDASVTWQAWKNLTLTAGLKNVFDEDPPFSNQGTTFQGGYDPRFADPIGRAVILRATFAFK